MSPNDEQLPFPPELSDEAGAEELEEVWSSLSQLRPDPLPRAEVDEAWVEVASRAGLGRSEEPASGRKSPQAHSVDSRSRQVEGRRRCEGRSDTDRKARALPGRVLNHASRVAAMAAVLVGLYLGWDALSTVTVEAGPGQTAAVRLPDGGTVELNSGSVLTRSRWSFGEERARKVSLAGEAFFEVQEGAHPFRVETFNARVVVLGTQFNVRARDEPGGGTEVALQEGAVRLEDREARQAVALAPGQASGIARGATTPVPPTEVPLETVLSWRTQGFSMTDRPLAAVLAEIERRFDLRIDALSPSVPLDERLTLHYRSVDDPVRILRDIATTHELRFRETNEGYELY